MAVPQCQGVLVPLTQSSQEDAFDIHLMEGTGTLLGQESSLQLEWGGMRWITGHTGVGAAPQMVIHFSACSEMAAFLGL